MTTPTYPITVQPGGHVDIALAFNPTAQGPRSGSLTVTSNAGATIVALTGTATAGTTSAALAGTIAAHFGASGTLSQPPLKRLLTQGAKIVDTDGTEHWLRGCNWHGAEGSNHMPHVLWGRSYTGLIDEIAGMGFNLLRLPLSADIDDTTMPQSLSAYFNPTLDGLTTLQVLDALIAYCGQKGIYVMLDCHRLTSGAGTDSAIASGTLSAIQAFWLRLANRYKDNTTVIGADLYNEPYTVDWNTLAGYYETLGNAILAVAPNWLIVCEGTGTYNGVSYWWGGQLAGAASRPVNLNVAHRLVYSAHDYGQGVSQQTWLKSTSNTGVANWPNNLDAIWDAAWGFLVKNGTAPVILGEYGGKLGFSGSGAVDSSQADGTYEQQWISHLVQYMKANKVSSTYWTFTSQSGDTGGLLCDGDSTEQTGKLALLAPLFA
jgi:endoglucanase